MFKWVNHKNLIIIVLLISIPHILSLVDYVDLIYNVLCRIFIVKFPVSQNQKYNNYEPGNVNINYILEKEEINFDFLKCLKLIIWKMLITPKISLMQIYVIK